MTSLLLAAIIRHARTFFANNTWVDICTQLSTETVGVTDASGLLEMSSKSSLQLKTSLVAQLTPRKTLACHRHIPTCGVPACKPLEMHARTYMLKKHFSKIALCDPFLLLVILMAYGSCQCWFLQCRAQFCRRVINCRVLPRLIFMCWPICLKFCLMHDVAIQQKACTICSP